MSTKSKWLNHLITLGVGAGLILLIFAVPADTSKVIDGKERSQPAVCDGKDRIITFSNFVTAHSWLKKIPDEYPGAHSIGIEFDTDKKVALSYRCTSIKK